MALKIKKVVTLVDGSGSMSSVKHEAITGYRGHLKRLQETPVTTKVSLTIFDDERHPAYADEFVANAKGLDECGAFDPDTGGNTALFDAILEEIAEHEKRESKDLIFAILTDGQDTSSTHTTQEVREKIEAKRRDGWQFIFIGPHKELGKELGVPAASSYALGAGGHGMAQAFEQMTETTERLLLGPAK